MPSPPGSVPDAPRLRAAALWLLGATLLLVALGGAVRATDSGLACPDWPACYGQWLPGWDLNIWLEHGHRLLAGAVGLGVLALAGWAVARHRANRAVLWGSVAALAIIGIQSALGAAVVLLHLRPWLVTAHLGTAAVLLACLVLVAVRARPPEAPASPRAAAAERRLRRRATAVAALVFAQLLVGAQATGLGAAYVFDAWPVWLAETSVVEAAHPREVFHLAHRGLGYVVTAAVLLLALGAWRDRRGAVLPRRAWGLAAAGGALVTAQAGLGIANVVTRADVVPAVAHLTGAALLWTTVIALVLLLRHRGGAAAGHVDEDRIIARSGRPPSRVDGPARPSDEPEEVRA